MIGNVIKKLRELKGIKQGLLAEKCGISKIYLAKIEGDERNPSMEVLKSLSIELGVPLSILTFLGHDEPNIKNNPEYKQLSAVVDAFLLSLIKNELELSK